ncbi:hypothetical protein A3I27_01010 [Candidatus Giovannonibacteria bacterium RIFCSPLOWO2_02_FULL_43_11b]|uniref:Uncharacterized protein n=1 Tax=Candidatus Giovannonibacteria bacterium RIFCSPHIGHO2_12_FULL_43_15 TaxID=1798341 RepID=A0A1F5WPD2_9BACT|nr:MAG: hypothetical protein A2739_01215 [Candidatus Giovannonibacteria bacterium RIFCSPHIGHO2_01_FULL_43_100]OGF66766.1 MAG: hypothetical protein A3B97_02535 [Candidatus Giovannonibacteria bacterium RIFCSPHIGHO2_02_FULL_43_32]OGF77542.1 MAG: hypothetical protein A3F23_01030 [Candidatus Giovannonibacteria bacterium RIFCSPHIGHO2_12_FULL_43_15]OGF79003.1 MAG: hypothetical protein A3A15_00655 [Candidatus Giovannonibacteria bacterium RIFCSPLOWO2_01_FULL_43_60]OGF90383.1 MAG: hypothetical protein A3
MPTFALLAVWSVWGEESCHKKIGSSFDAETPEHAFKQLQIKHPFLEGLPWSFAGKDYKLLCESEIQVGKKFKMQNASEYGD